jgi:hypothetical protein
MEPNKGALRKWVAALRSGEYEQGRERLHSLDRSDPDNEKHTYCCLGVACEVFNRENVDEPLELRQATRDRHNYIVSYDGEPSVLPARVARWLGVFPDQNPAIDGRYLSVWNDGNHVSNNITPRDFEAIADMIERHYQLLED